MKEIKVGDNRIVIEYKWDIDAFSLFVLGPEGDLKAMKDIRYVFHTDTNGFCGNSCYEGDWESGRRMKRPEGSEEIDAFIDLAEKALEDLLETN